MPQLITTFFNLVTYFELTGHKLKATFFRGLQRFTVTEGSAPCY